MHLDGVAIESSIPQATSVFQGNKAFNEKKTKCVKLAPRSDQKSYQTQSTRLTIAYPLRNHTRIEAFGWQSEKASSLGRRELAGLRGMRDIRTKAAIDDINYYKEQNSFFNEEKLKLIFTRRFTKLLERNQYISPLPEQEHEFSSINYHTNPLHVREEWREAFLIAKGQIFDQVIIKGKIIEGDLLHNSPHEILLLREASTQINPVSNDRLSSTIATMLEQHPNQDVIACISMNKTLDSYFTCLKVDEKLAYQFGQTLNKDQYQQRLQQLKLFEEERKSILERQMQFLRINSETLFMQDDIKQKLSQNIVERIKDLETELLRLQREERMELRRYQSFYMLLGTPEIRSIVENVRKMCTLASITLIASNENIDAPEERNQPDNGSEHALQKCHYIARLAFKHVNNDKIGKEHTNQFVLQQQKFKQIFLQVLAEQDSSLLLLQRYATELSSISSDARVFDLPTQWQKAFLIARGQAYESARKDGTRLSGSGSN